MTVHWDVVWADALHLQMRDSNGAVLQDLNVTGGTSATMAATSATASFAVVASNISGTVEGSAPFTQWNVYSVAINPSGTQLMRPGEQRNFTASVNAVPGTPNGVVWSSVPDGAITPEGLFTAPSVTGNGSITATSAFDPSKKTTISVVVGLPPTITSFMANPRVVASGMPTTLTWQSAGATYQAISTPPDPFGNGTQSWNVTYASSFIAYPTKTTTYTFSASNAFGDTTSNVQVVVSPVTAIAITPTKATVYTGSAITFGASITSTGSTAVTWSTDDPKGAISGSGLSATYTSGNTPGTYHVTVTSVLDPTRSATASVAVVMPEVTLSLSPVSPTLYVGQSIDFGVSIQVTGTNNTNLIWSSSGGSLANHGASATYIAPIIPGVYTVTVKSEADLSKTATATVTVIPVSVTLSINPTTIGLYAGQAMTFGASINVQGSTNADVTWSASGGASITGNGTQATYTAPAGQGTYTVTVASALDPSKTATATVNVAPKPAGVSITPGAVVLPPGGSQSFTSKVDGVVDQTVTWSILESGGGTISQGGSYTAPGVPGTYTIQAVSTGNPALANQVQVTVMAIKVTPGVALLSPGQTQAFAAEILGASTPSVDWSILEGPVGGSIDAMGLYTAPLAQGIYHVQAATADGRNAVVQVTVGFMEAVVIAPDIQILEAGTYVVTVRLKASNGQEAEASTQADLIVGNAAPEVRFNALDLKNQLAVDGPYTISLIRVDHMLPDDRVPAAEERVDLGTIQVPLMAQAPRPWVDFTGPVSTMAQDLNGNGLIDRLVVTVGVNVVQEGDYTYAASLVDAQGRELDFTPSNVAHLRAGAGSVTLTFDGAEIAKANVDGPFGIRNLILSGPAIGKADFPGAITGYLASQFEGYVAPGTPMLVVFPTKATPLKPAKGTKKSTQKPRQSKATLR